MKKKISILISVILIVTCLSFLSACGKDDPSTTLSLQEQVNIAKTTYTGIYNAMLSNKAASLETQTRYAIDYDRFEEIFSRDEYDVQDSGLSGIEYKYFILANPANILINEVGTSSLNYTYNIDYNFINTGGADVNGYKDFLPNQINFIGITTENGYNVVNAELENKIGNDTSYTTLKSYYKSETDFGFEYLSYVINDNDEITDKIYLEVDYKTSTQIQINWTNKNGYQIYFVNSSESKKISSNIELSILDKEFLDNLFVTEQTNFKSQSEELQKQNNNGQLKTLSDEIITLDFDIDEIYSMVE